MKNSTSSVFQIPNYAQPEPVQEVSNKPKIEQKPIPPKQKTTENENIFSDLLAKSQEITKARIEASEFLRGAK